MGHNKKISDQLKLVLRRAESEAQGRNLKVVHYCTELIFFLPQVRVKVKAETEQGTSGDSSVQQVGLLFVVCEPSEAG